MRICTHCGVQYKKESDAYWWFTHDFCSRDCAMLEAKELKRKYWDIAKLLKEKK
jgi:hypothetical protein